MRLRLTAPSLDFWVDVHLRSFGGRWIAVAEITDEKELGLGSTSREALASAISVFGQPVVEKLLATLPDRPASPALSLDAIE
jgi:hypothetical protein